MISHDFKRSKAERTFQTCGVKFNVKLGFTVSFDLCGKTKLTELMNNMNINDWLNIIHYNLMSRHQ